MNDLNIDVIKSAAQVGIGSHATTVDLCSEVEDLAGNYNEALDTINGTIESLDSVLNLPMNASAGEVMRFITRLKIRLMAAQVRLTPYNLGENRE